MSEEPADESTPEGPGDEPGVAAPTGPGDDPGERPDGPSTRVGEVQFGTGIVLGIALGVVAGLVAGDMAVWVGVGAGVGVALDVANRSGMLGLGRD